MRPPIYDDYERIDLAPQRNDETSFAFFNRAGGSLWSHSRALHQEWADRLGDREYADVRAALRSDDAQARSAFLELYLHECLVRGGHEVVIHPELYHTSRKPDFLAIRGATRVFIEAITPGTSPADRAAANRIGALLSALDEVGDDNFVLMTTSITQTSNSAPAANFRNRIRKWLTQLDPNSVGSEDLPSQTFEQDGWSVTVKAIPIKPSSRSSTRRSIGVYAHSAAQFIDDGAKLVSALESKAKRYGQLDAAYVVAVGTTSYVEVDEYALNALYGSVSWTIDGLNPWVRGARNRDGYFGSPGAWKNRQVSAVLTVDQLALHDPTRARVSLWTHPNPLHPLPNEPMFPGVIHDWNGRCTDKREALDSRRLLGLTDDWPQGRRWKAD